MKTLTKTWTTTKYPRLYRHVSGAYYARVSACGKETWRSLKTKFFVAKTELDQKQADAEQQAKLHSKQPVTKKIETVLNENYRGLRDALRHRLDVYTS